MHAPHKRKDSKLQEKYQISWQLKKIVSQQTNTTFYESFLFS